MAPPAVSHSIVPHFSLPSSLPAWLARPFAVTGALVLAVAIAVASAAPARAAPARAVPVVGSAVAGSPVNSAPAKRLPDSTEEAISGAAIRALAELNEFVNSGNRDAFDLYRAFADRLAVPVAVALDLNVRELQRSWADADLPRQQAVIAGLTQLGVPYRLNTSTPFKSFDCSGLTSYAWGIAGIPLARSSRAQFYAATPIKAEKAQLGDLVWRPGHVAMYLGVPGAVLQAPTEGRSVEIQLMNEQIARWVRYADPIE